MTWADMDMGDGQQVSILLLGDADCGKSTFLSRLSRGPKALSSKEPIPLLRDGDQPFAFNVTYSKQPYRFEFYDTSSPENWQLLKPDVIVLCYDISQRLSLIDTQRFWVNQTKIHFTAQRELPVLLLGLKRDLRSEDDPNGIIYPQEAYRIAQEMRCDRYMECSAVTGELLQEVFEDICKTAALSLQEGGEGSAGLSEAACGVM